MAQKYPKKSRQPKKSSLPMILMIVGGLVLLGGALYLAFGNSNQPKAAVTVKGTPSLKVDQDQIDLGNQKLGETVQTGFTLSNIGDQPLKLTEAPYIEVVEGC